MAKKTTPKRKAVAGKKAKAKATSARRAVNIKVNIASKNPKKRRPARTGKNVKTSVRRMLKTRARNTRARKGSAVAKLMRRNPAKMKFIIAANTENSRYYWVSGNKFTQSRAGAHRFDQFDDAAFQAQRQIRHATPQVQSIGVERA